MSETVRLVVINEHSEVLEEFATVEECRLEIKRLRDQAAGMQKDLNAWRLRYADLARDKEREAVDHALWPIALELFSFWKTTTGHTKSPWTADRFWTVLPLLKKHGADLCKAAIIGCQYDHFTTTRKNGTQQHHNGWDLIFRGADKMEEYVNRAPADTLLALKQNGRTPKDPPARSSTQLEITPPSVKAAL